jgi:hypothetical protein
MAASANALRWSGQPGHYEVYYLTLTDPHSGLGVWIRYTMVAPLPDTGESATCALWLLAMDPAAGPLGRKQTFEIEALSARPDPFELRIGEARLTDGGMAGAFADVEWELEWEPAPRSYDSVHPLLQRLGAAQTVLVLPHADVAVRGTIGLPGRRLELDGVHGGQAHLWGSKHARRWAWVHCGDFVDEHGSPAPGTFVDAVSAVVSRFGREIGPNTPVVARVEGRDFYSTSPLRIIRNPSQFQLTGWTFEATDGSRRLVGEASAQPGQLAGVTYHDPDGELAYCYNSETASLRLRVLERAGRAWRTVSTLTSEGRAHFEYAQRQPVDGVELLTH